MGDVPGLPPTKSVTFINQGVVPDTLPGEGTLYANGSGDLSFKGSNGVVTDLITGASGGITGSGAAGEVTYWSGTSTVTGNSGFTFNGTVLGVPAINLPLSGANLLWGAGNGFGTTLTNELALVNNNILTVLWGADNSTSLGGAFTVAGASTFNGASFFNVLATFYGGIFSAGARIDVNPILTQEIAAPSATAGYGTIYTYTDGNLHYVSPGGTDYALTPPSSGGITALTGDVSASGSGSVTATVNDVGGVTAANVATAANAVNAAGSAGYTLQATGTAGGESYQPYPSSVQRVIYATAGSTVSPTLAQSGTLFINEGINTSLNATLPVPLSSPTVSYGFLNSANQTSSFLYTITIPSSVTVYIPGSDTGLTNTTITTYYPQAYMQLTSIGAATYEITQLVGTWATASGINLTGTVTNLTPTSGNVLTDNGVGVAPTFQAAAAAALSTMPASMSINTQAGAGGTYTLLSSDRGKIVTDAGTTVQQTYSLPSAPALGDTYYMISTTASNGATAMKINCLNASHVIQLPTVTSTAGTAHGIIANQNARANGANIQITYVATNTWRWTGGYPYDWTNY